MNCIICNHNITLQDKLVVKEMMFGTREEFDYYQCSECKALQIKDLPKDIFKYYDNYYTQKKGYRRISEIKKFLWGIRSELALTVLYPVIAFLRYNSILHWAHVSKINKKSRILDVGCGNGDVLFEFSKHGFKNLYGIDPYLEDIILPKIEFEKTDLLLFDTKSKFDLIMFNHSLEHIYEHHNILKKAFELLNNNGTVMIRIPVINKAFELYRENWVQIDAPRHFVIHSLKSMSLLCEMNEAVIYNYFFDSFALQFLGSEQSLRGIALYSPNSYKNDLGKSIFTMNDIEKYKTKAKQFNIDGLGDQAVFFIRKKSESKL